MRISSGAIYEANVNNLNQQQGKLMHTQQQLASGRRMLTPADDPFASARALEISQSDSANTQLITNRNAARHSTAMAESILQSVTSLLQDVRTATVADGSGVLTTPDKNALAEDMRGRLDELVGLANSTDGLGNYLFSGYQGRTQPFVLGPEGMEYKGDDGQRVIQVASSRRLPTSDSGADIFMRIKNGNGIFTVDASRENAGTGIQSQGTVTDPAALTGHSYQISFKVETLGGASKTSYEVTDLATKQVVSKDNPFVSGQAINIDGMQMYIKGAPSDKDTFKIAPSENESLFKTLSDLIAELESSEPIGGAAAKAQYTISINRALNNIDRGINNVSTIRTSLGSRLRELDSLSETGADVGLQYKSKLSELQDVEFNKAVSDLNQQQTSLTAAQKSFKQTADLSLFNYI